MPRPQRVLLETAEALRETGDLIDVADDAMMRAIATAFQTAAAVFARLRESQGHDLLGIATFLGQIGADLQGTPGQPGWVGWTLWSIRCELEALSQSDPQAVAELVPETDRLPLL
jgi:hypothetical protein